jgi:nucleoid-associated protein YgaU
MGLFSFAKDIGDKIFHRNKDATPASQPASTPAATPAAPAEPSAQEIANLLIQRIQQNAKINNLSVNYNGDTDTVTINGSAPTQADREKAILAAGNVQHVAQVQDNISVDTPEPESRMYTVKSGDTLSKIAQDVYGNGDYMKIFEANKPLLSDPNKIYPGQVLRRL